jgi:hypothetical protein
MRIIGALTQQQYLSDVELKNKHIIFIEQPEVAHLGTGYGAQCFDPQHSTPSDIEFNRAFLERLYKGNIVEWKAQNGVAACEAAWNFNGCCADNTLISMPDKWDPDSLAALWVIHQRQMGKRFSDLPGYVQQRLQMIAAHDCRRVRSKKPAISPQDVDSIVSFLKTTLTYNISNFTGVCMNKGLDAESKLVEFQAELFKPSIPRFYSEEHLITVASEAKNIVEKDKHVELVTKAGSGLLVDLLYLYGDAAILHMPYFKGHDGRSEATSKFSVMVEDGLNHPDFIPYFKKEIGEEGWGGNISGIVASPQGKSSQKTLDQVRNTFLGYLNNPEL